MINLAIDLGNTRTKLGLFKGKALMEDLVWPPSWTVSQLLEWATNQKVENIILSMTGKAPEGLEAVLQRRFRLLVFSPDTPTPVQNHYRSPQTLGRDRLAAAVGAFELFPESNCLVIDAGTCITYEVLESGGRYRGGNIAPGLRMRLRAMSDYTARLPLLEPGDTAHWIGDSTESAMRNGAQLGAILEIEGFIERCRGELGLINVILTGGDADFFAKRLKSRIFVNQHLVLQGLNKILTYNVERLE